MGRRPSTAQKWLPLCRKKTPIGVTKLPPSWRAGVLSSRSSAWRGATAAAAPLADLLAPGRCCRGGGDTIAISSERKGKKA